MFLYLYILYPISYILYPISYILYSIFYILYPISYILYPISYILYLISYISYPISYPCSSQSISRNIYSILYLNLHTFNNLLYTINLIFDAFTTHNLYYLHLIIIIFNLNVIYQLLAAQ